MEQYVQLGVAGAAMFIMYQLMRLSIEAARADRASMVEAFQADRDRTDAHITAMILENRQEGSRDRELFRSALDKIGLSIDAVEGRLEQVETAMRDQRITPPRRKSGGHNDNTGSGEHRPLPG